MTAHHATTSNTPRSRQESTATLHLATTEGPVTVAHDGRGWRANRSLDVRSVSCVAVDRSHPQTIFCGTAKHNHGAWRSDDGGATWRRIFQGIGHESVTSIAVAGGGRAGERVVYLGAEPSAVFRSGDLGETWEPCPGLTDLPSSDEWSFPPRPDTHHVRWIEPDMHEPGRLYVAIEAGALVRSVDGGRTWIDRVPTGPWDTHQLAMHPKAPGRLWSAAGDGFFESEDGGDTWARREQGLPFNYCWSVALDPGDPGTALLTASPGPREAHGRDNAHSAVFRRTGDGPWQQITEGLPPSRGTRAPRLATHPDEPGAFYLAADDALYASTDAGVTWRRPQMNWPLTDPDSRVHAMAAGALDRPDTSSRT